MIAQLQAPGFMREKIRFLAMLARDLRTSIAELGDLDFFDEGPEDLDESDAAELVGSMEALDSDETLYRDGAYWMPRNAYAAMLQSSLDLYYRVNDSVGAVDSPFGEALREDPLVPASLTPVHGGGVTQLRQAFRMNKRDPRFALVLQAKNIKRRKGTPPFPDNSGRTARLSAKARVLLFGDWASGMPDAVTLARTMWSHYLQPELGRRELHVVHLGDGYYAGLARDYRLRFLPHWPVPAAFAQQVSSWNLAGNHDMYSGGHGYFAMLKDPRFAAQHQSSYFLLENDRWQVFGLDTSFDPRDWKGDIGELYGEQSAWVAQKRDLAPNKKCVLLTHHQPFCAYSVIKEQLERRLRPVQNAHQIDAWFWGHEHLCAVYDSHNNIRYPVLLGHGGFPEKPKSRVPGAPPMKYEWLATGSSGDVLFGFAVLDFDDARIDVQLVDQNGKVHYKFAIT